MEEERERRIGRNQSLFREVNERIQRVSGTLRTGTDRMTILCECGNQSCAEHIDVTVADYERVRGQSTLFLVRPGHAVPEVEEVVEQHEGFEVARKGGPAAEVAEQLDPRED